LKNIAQIYLGLKAFPSKTFDRFIISKERN
jgi:hypothetical protein